MQKHHRIWFAAPLAIIALLAGMAVVSVGRGPERAYALVNCDTNGAGLDGEEAAFLTLINNYRAQQTVTDRIPRATLLASTNLNRAAAWLATDLGTAPAYFDHTDRYGRGPSTRVQNCGYASGAGENIAAGTVWDTAAEAFEAWRNSSGHNANMLNTGYTMIGIGRAQVAGSPYNWYWVTDFGSFNDGTGGGGGGATPTPAATNTPTRTPTRTPTPGAASPTPTRTPTPTPAASGGAAIQSPAPGSKFNSSTVSFTWNAASGAQYYLLSVGSTPGGTNYFNNYVFGTTQQVTNLPIDGRTVYVRLTTVRASGQTANSYTYTAAGGSASPTPTRTPGGATPTRTATPRRTPTPGGGGSATPTPTATATQPPASGPGAITAPVPGSVIRGGSATFRWNSAGAGTGYLVYFGTSPGGGDLGAFYTTATSMTVSGLPTDGRTIHARVSSFGSASAPTSNASYTTGP